MRIQQPLVIQPQPNETTCGPTCLHAVLGYFGYHAPLDEFIRDVPTLAEGGTLAVMLANYALRLGYRATVYTYNLEIFDPSWFRSPDFDIASRLRLQIEAKPVPRIIAASHAYLEFLQLGGQLKMETLNEDLVVRYLEQNVPILTGLSVTYLYQCRRERSWDQIPDDIVGVPTGHFVVLCGVDRDRQSVFVADPYLPNPLAEGQYYEAPWDRLICAILLGVLTYDANLLILQPPAGSVPAPIKSV